MDKQTLSNYGWLVIVTLILAVMLALATPFGGYIGNTVTNMANSFIETNNKTLDEDNINNLSNEWYKEFNGLSGINIDLATNTWEDVQKVSKAGKVTVAGWSVGDTKDLEINGLTKTATLIGIDHDGKGTTTWMVTSSGGIGVENMNKNLTNEGGWEASYMREWLNSTIYNSMTDTKDYIKAVSKDTNNIGYNGNSVSATIDKVFLLSLKEAGMEWQMADDDYLANPNYVGMNALNKEGTTYEWFTNVSCIGLYFWLRSPYSDRDDSFLFYDDDNFMYYYTTTYHTVRPAFVIG